jgi:hypothetical protein
MPKLNPMDKNHKLYKESLRLLLKEYLPKMIVFKDANQGENRVNEVIRTLINCTIYEIKEYLVSLDSLFAKVSQTMIER